MSNISAQLVDSLPTLWFPQDHGLLTWAFDPSVASGTYTLATAGTVYAVDLKVAENTTVTNVVYKMTTAGGTLTSGQCFVGLYQGGALLGVSASQHTVWAGSTGVLTTALTSAVQVSQGVVTAAFFFNGTTGPTLLTGGSGSGNTGLAAASSRYATADTGKTTAFAGTLGTKSALSQTPWVALS